MTFAEHIIDFNQSLSIDVPLPEDIMVLNPFRGPHAELILKVAKEFYHKYFDDNLSRHLILGINPGRLGAGATGLPFTDTKRLEEFCGIRIEEFSTHEPSSVFVYDVIRAYGGVNQFYRHFYIGSVCPLGFVRAGLFGEINVNYYDDKVLQELLKPFILSSIIRQMNFGINRDVVYVLGTGKNFQFLEKLNQQYSFAKKLIPLEHPRFIMQYKSRQKEHYIEKYLQAFHDEL